MGRYNATEQAGLHAVGHLFTRHLGWIFREQPVADMGIDAHVELVDGEPSGRLLGLQIKSGGGNFAATADGLIYRGSLTHLDYWLGHALPVVLVAHLPETGETFWVHVTEAAVTRTPKAWKILIPTANRLDIHAREPLKTLFEGSLQQQRWRRLALDAGLMRHIAAGGKVSVELEDWYNKSLNRSPITVFVEDAHGDVTVALEWFSMFTSHDMKWVAEAAFPWATARVDMEFYEENSDFDETEEDLLGRANDLDNDIPPYEPDPDVVYPYSDSAGEVAGYRLQLRLNDLGRAYLRVSDFLDAPAPDTLPRAL
jgi:hypothetical protein